MAPTETTTTSCDRARLRFACRRRSLLLLLLAMAGIAPATEAQEAGSPEELLRAGELRTGDGIYVTDGDGRRLKGTFVDLSPAGLTIEAGDMTWTVPARDTRKIERQDSLLNGVLIGATVGAALTCRLHPGCGSHPVSVTMHTLVGHGAVHLLLVGAAIGALADGLWHRTLYEASATARVSVSPLVSRERAGAGLTVRW